MPQLKNMTLRDATVLLVLVVALYAGLVIVMTPSARASGGWYLLKPPIAVPSLLARIRIWRRLEEESEKESNSKKQQKYQSLSWSDWWFMVRSDEPEIWCSPIVTGAEQCWLDPDAPLSRWEKVGNFDSAEACDTALLNLRSSAWEAVNEAGKTYGNNSPEELEHRRDAFRANKADCYATDDPRLSH